MARRLSYAFSTGIELIYGETELVSNFEDLERWVECQVWHCTYAIQVCSL